MKFLLILVVLSCTIGCWSNKEVYEVYLKNETSDGDEVTLEMNDTSIAAGIGQTAGPMLIEEGKHSWHVTVICDYFIIRETYKYHGDVVVDRDRTLRVTYSRGLYCCQWDLQPWSLSLPMGIAAWRGGTTGPEKKSVPISP